MSEEKDEPMIPTPADFGHFHLEKELGHGGMGGVYLGRDKMLDRPVAIKVMLKSLGDDPTFVERFQREAQAAARLNHPNIAQIYSFGQEQGMPYIAMELVKGGSLDKEMEANPGALDPVHVMKIGRALAEALAKAAENGLVHGDVKPENVLFDEAGNPKLVDFGLAAMQGDSSEIWGTPYYISPEKVRRQKIDFRADIYSLGGTLYHALTGQPPFEGEDATAVVKARFEAPPRKPSEVRADLPPELDEILLRMLETEPAMRYPTWESLLGDIKRYLDKAGPEKKAGGPKVRFKGRRPMMKLSADGGVEVPAEGESVLEPLEGEEGAEEKKGLSIGAMVGIAAGGLVLVILLVVGGLFWYLHAEKVREQREHQEQIVGKQQLARAAIAKTVKAATDFGRLFTELTERIESDMRKATDGVKGKLSPEILETLGGPLVPPETKDMADARAYAAEVEANLAAADAAEAAAKAAEAAKKAEEAKAAAANAATNAPAASTNAPAAANAATNAPAAAANAATNAPAAAANAATNAPAKAAAPADAAKPDAKAAPAKPAAEEKKAEAEEKAEEGDEEKKEPEKPKVEVPPALKDFRNLWLDVWFCKAANLRVQADVAALLKTGEKAKALTAEDVETTKALAALSQKLVEAFDALKGQKWVELTQRKGGLLKSKTPNLVRILERQLDGARRRAEKAAKDKAAAEAKAKKEAEEAAAHKELVEAELKQAEEKAASLGEQLRRLMWDNALRQLNAVLAEFKTAEGKEALRLEIDRVKFMQGLQKYFVQKGRGFRFRNGSTIEKIDDKSLTIKSRDVVDRKTKKVVTPGRAETYTWDRFFKKRMGDFNRLVIDLVEKGRETTHVGPLDWSHHMLGSALLMQTLFPEDANVPKRVEGLVKKCVKEFEPSRKYAEKWFADVELEKGEE